MDTHHGHSHDHADGHQHDHHADHGHPHVGQVRMRWIGHALRAEADIVVDPHLTVIAAHERAVAAEHALIHAVPRLTAATVHTDHLPHGTDPHASLTHHHAAPAGATNDGGDGASHRH